MVMFFKLTVFMVVGYHILALRATSRALSSVHEKKSLRVKRQTDLKGQYDWDSTWRYEKVNGVTTITSAIYGNTAPGEGIVQLASAVWSYTYSYPNNDTQDTKNDGPSSNLTELRDNPPANLSSNAPPTSSTRENDSPPDSGSLDSDIESSRPPNKPTSLEDDIQRISSKVANPLNSVRNATNFATQRTTGDVQGWLDSHNLYRSRYGSASVSWDSDLADKAREVASSCTWVHTKNNPRGENLAAGQDTQSDVVISWVEGPDEMGAFDPDVDIFTHFTQVVWASTTHIGCAMVTCVDIAGSSLPQSPANFWVCEYYPKGNIVGQFKENVKAAKGGQPLGSKQVYTSRLKNPGSSYFVPAPVAE